ncbi:MAG: alpha/beta fold hydrolase [Actinophytocola sp.]|nr:alpha/beta fold hydrolase [Actinophytocola sp.]
MTTAAKRGGAPQPDGEAPVRVGYNRFAGVRTRVLEAGPAKPGPSRSGLHRRSRRQQRSVRFVMFHGYCDSADTWQRLLRELAAARHSAIAVDLPGFGEADPLRPGPILPQLDAFVAAVVREQSAYGDVVLVGNSLGGTISLRAAQRPRLPVAGVVSIAAPGLSDSWLIRTVRRYPFPLRMYASLPLPIPGALVRTVADNVVPLLMYATPRARDDEDVLRFTALFPDYKSTRARLAQARQLAGELTDCYELDRIQAPLLVVACGKDRLVRADSGKMLHTLVPHSRLLLREDWGHCPQLDHAPEIQQLVTYFAASCTRAGEEPITKPEAGERSAAS